MSIIFSVFLVFLTHSFLNGDMGDSKDIRESLCEIISLSFIKEECSAMLSESLTTEAAFFPTKAELSIFISLRVSLDLIRCLR
jgi:hypothetical protein